MPTALLPMWPPELPPIEDITRRDVLKGVGALGAGWVLAGCGEPGPDADAPQADAVTRVVRDSVGEIEVPADPQRVVTMWRFIRPHVASLGAPLVATGQPPSIPIAEDIPSWLDWQPPEDLVVFDQNEPDLEVVAKAAPDLILALPGAAELDRLREIAPTAQITGAALDYQQLLEALARVLGAEPALEEMVSTYKARVDTFRRHTLPALGGRTVSVFRASGPTDIRLEMRDSFPGQILADGGVARPSSQDAEGDEGSGFVTISVERLDEVDADFIVVLLFDDDARAQFTALTENPLWQRLRGVQAGHVYAGEYSTWFGGHYLAGVAVLDDLAAIVAGTKEPFA